MMALGGMSERGQGVAADPGAAVAWYQKASAAGSAEAGYKLGEMYEEGRGVDKNPTEAANAYSQAAKRGVTPAMRAYARHAGRGHRRAEERGRGGVVVPAGRHRE